MSSNTEKFQSHLRALVSPGQVIKYSVSIGCAFIILTGSAAWSFEKTVALGLPLKTDTAIHDVSYVQQVPSSTVADSCLPLLKSHQETPLSSATERNQRSAGQVAALSLAFGVRFALGPLENPAFDHKAESSAQAQNNLRALKIAAYRNCQKEQALQAQADMNKRNRSGS